MEDKEKSIKQQRVENYFIEAAKELIIRNGAPSVTVRKIADAAGYSYGSIYNYYKDLDELMFHVKNAMIYDMMENMQRPNTMPTSVEDIQKINRMFADFFMDNPNIYEFFYNYPIKTTGKTPIDDIGFSEANLMTYQYFVDQGIISKEDLHTVFMTILSSLYGQLNLYFSSNGVTKEHVHMALDSIIEFTLRKK